MEPAHDRRDGIRCPLFLVKKPLWTWESSALVCLSPESSWYLCKWIIIGQRYVHICECKCSYWFWRSLAKLTKLKLPLRWHICCNFAYFAKPAKPGLVWGLVWLDWECSASSYTHTEKKKQAKEKQQQQTKRHKSCGLSKRGRNYRLPLTLRQVKYPPSLRVEREAGQRMQRHRQTSRDAEGATTYPVTGP